MTTRTRFHAEHQLDQLAGQFEHWRQTRSHAHDRIPAYLWDQAVALTSTLSASRVAKHLRLGGSDLKKQIALRQGDSAQMTAPVGFVEVPQAPASPHGRHGVEVELQRPDGARLRIHAPAVVTLPLAAMVHSFLEAR